MGGERPEKTPDIKRFPSGRMVLVSVWGCALLCALTLTPEAQQQPETDPAAVALNIKVVMEALPLISGGNYLGLGEEAARLDAWLEDRRGPFGLDPSPGRLRDGTGRRTALSTVMAQTLTRLNQWYGLQASPDKPISHAQLKTGALSPAAIASIQRVFETSIRRGVRVAGRWLTPEAGGEATLDKDLRLVEGVDSRWATVRELVGASNATEVARVAAGRPSKVAEIDTHQLLKLGLERFRMGFRGGADEVDRAVATIALNTAATFSHDPEAQFTLIAGTDWSGRYVGRFHTHAPREAGGEWMGAEAPSFEDMENAVRDGQYLTVAFQPDGFDLYDAQGLADAGRVDLTLMKVIRYRSSSWRDYFQALLGVVR